MKNFVLQHKNALSENNYIRKADPDNSYWFDFSFSKLEQFKQIYGDTFNLIIVGSENVESDFYVLPFLLVKHIFVDEFVSKDAANDGKVRAKRWIGTIKLNQLKISNFPESLNIANYYGNFLPDYSKVVLADGDSSESNDYAIENLKREIYVRQKQSKFRKKVLENFNHKCCLSGITEESLLVSSHIIPWSERIDTRLNPSNGICLSILYDKLFDLGFITFDDNFRVLITPRIAALSDDLQTILKNIEGKEISEPVKYPIRIDFIKYHRENKFDK